MKNHFLNRASIVGCLAAVALTLAACAPLPDGALQNADLPADVQVADDQPTEQIPTEQIPMDEQPSGADELDEDWLEWNEASCITVVDGVEPADAVLAISKGTARKVPGRQAAEDVIFSDSGDEVWLASGEIDGHTFVWEDNGFGCADTAVAKVLSRSGTYASMYWNVNALMSFVLADNGRVDTEFEALFAPDKKSWKAMTAAGAQHVSATVWEANPEKAGLAAQAGIFGLDAPASPEWLDLPGVEFWAATF